VEDEHEIQAKHFPLAIIEAIMLPLQGLLNKMVFLRPTYLMRRHQNPDRTRLLALKRTIFGEDSTKKGFKEGALARSPPPTENQIQLHAITEGSNHKMVDDDLELGIYDTSTNDTSTKVATASRIPRRMISSLTASIGDFDHVLENDKEDKRWGDSRSSRAAMKSPTRLPREMISSLTASIGDFDKALENDKGDKRWGDSRSTSPDLSSWAAMKSPTRLPREMISSLTASIGDFDNVLENDKGDKRWGDGRSTSPDLSSWAPMKSPTIINSDPRLSESDVISEIPDQPDQGKKEQEFEGARWTSNSITITAPTGDNLKTALAVSLDMPRRIDSDIERTDDSVGRNDPPTHAPSLNFVLTVLPSRHPNQSDRTSTD
jgi:hypothetical protein